MDSLRYMPGKGTSVRRVPKRKERRFASLAEGERTSSTKTLLRNDGRRPLGRGEGGGA